MGYLIGTVQTFTTKRPGEVFASTHVNLLQDEVNAIETRLLSTLTHDLEILTGGLTISTGGLRVGGGSTLAALSVTGGVDVVGGSTFTTVQAAGSTFASLVTGNLTVSGAATGTFAPVRPDALVRSSTQSTLSSGGEFEGLGWDVEPRDAFTMHAAGSSQLVFSHSTGVYEVGLSMHVLASTQQFWRVRVVLNDSTTIVCGHSFSHGGGATDFAASIKGLVRVAATTDYVTAQVWSTSAATQADSTLAPSHLWTRKVSS